MSYTDAPYEHPGNTHGAEFIALINLWRQGVVEGFNSAPWTDEADIATPTLDGSWTNFGGAFQGARYWKDNQGVVHIEGLVTGGTGTIFTLDAGYRPTASHMFSVVGNNAFARVTVKNDGVVDLHTGSNVFLQLSGITFLAA